MSDQAIVFGQYQNLVGTLSLPQSSTSDVAVIFLNAGMLHHAGPFRLHVEMAREIARHGVPSLRFDLSGIGESMGVGAGGRSIDRAANETRQAMDYLQSEHGINKFVLFGLCSGADDSVHTALCDERVVGLTIMDGCAYHTRRYKFNRLFKYYLPRLMMPSKWMGGVRHLIGRKESMPATLQMGSDIREFPQRDVAVSQFQELITRGVQMHFVYTGGIAEYYNYSNQFFDMFADVSWKGRATVKYYAHMDHVARLCEDRRELVADVTKRMIVIAQSNTSEVKKVSEERVDSNLLDANPMILAFPLSVAQN